MFVAVVLIAFNLRPAITAFLPVLDVIASDLGIGPAAAGLLATVPTAVFGIVALAGPALVRRAGGEAVLALSSIVTFAGLVLRSLAPEPWTLGAAFVAAVAGIGIANVVLVPIIKQYFPRRLGLINGVYLGVMQIGPAVSPVLTAVLVEQGLGWQFATGLWAVPCALAAIAWGVQAVIARRSRASNVTATGSIVVAEVEPRIPFSRLARSPLAWGIMGVFAMNSLSTYTLLTLLPGLMTDAGESLTFGTVLVSVFALMATITSVTMPVLTTRVPDPFVLIAGCGVLLWIGLAGLWLAPLFAPILWMVFVGLGLGCFPIALTLMNTRSRTRAGAAGLSGFGQGVGYLVASLGPIGVGLARDATGGWTAPLLLLACTVPISVVSGWFATRRRMIED